MTGRGVAGAICASPPDGAQIATDLHTLLHRAHVPGPYVLAGHSFGGLYVRTYAAKYPDEVAGLVLVDSTAAHDTPVSAPKAGSYSILKHAVLADRDDFSLGLGRFLANTEFSTLPPKYRDDARATAATGKEMGGFLDEFGVANRSEAEAGTLRSLDAKPLIVLTATATTPRDGWLLRTRWSSCRPTASIASSRGDPRRLRGRPGPRRRSHPSDPRRRPSLRTGEPLTRP